MVSHNCRLSLGRRCADVGVRPEITEWCAETNVETRCARPAKKMSQIESQQIRCEFATSAFFFFLVASCGRFGLRSSAILYCWIINSQIDNIFRLMEGDSDRVVCVSLLSYQLAARTR